MRDTSKRMLYGGMILLECLLWGLGNPIIKIGGAAIAPFASIAMRFTLALAAFLLLFGRRVVAGLRGAPLLPCLVVSLFTALAFTLSSLSLMLTQATVAGFLMSLSVLFAPFVEPLILRTRFQWKALPLVALVCAGMYWLCGGDGTFVFGLGELLALLCSACFAIMLALSEKYIPQMDTITLCTLQCAVASVFSLILMFVFEGGYDVRALTWEGAGAMLYVALGSTCAAYVLQNTAIRHIPTLLASLAFCTEPVFTALFAYLLLGETLSARGLLGGAVVLAGVVAASVWLPPRAEA